MGTRTSNKQQNASMKGVAGSMLYGTVLSAESIKVVAESVGVVGISDDAAKELAEDISHKVKAVVQDAKKFMTHSKRSKMVPDDIDRSLHVRDVEAQYGFVSKDFIPFRFASGGGRELHFMDEKEVDLSEYMQNFTPKLPLEVTLRAHWLVVDGIQPTIPENPPPLSRDMQVLESVDPVSKLDQIPTIDMCSKPQTGKLHKLRNMETVHVKQLATHELSVEQQLYYKEITEACVGSDEPRRGEALQSLAADPGLHEMVPRLCTFISEGVKVNVVQNNLALLIYLMRMVKALLDNASLYLEKYLHELVPSVTTCIVSKQLCMRPELDNHWALRDFASRLMAQICKTFNTSTNCLQTRVTRIFSKALQNDKTHLSTLYGSIAGLSELGGEVVKVFIIGRLKFISDRIECHLVGASQSNTDKTAAGHIRAMVQKVCPPILKQIRNSPDYVEEYKNEFGFLGPSLCQAVIKLRNSPAMPLTPTATTNAPITSAAQTATTCRTLPTNKTMLSSGAIAMQHQTIVQQTSPQSPVCNVIQNQTQLIQTQTQQYQNEMDTEQMQSITYFGTTPPSGSVLGNSMCMGFTDSPSSTGNNINVVNNVGSTVVIDSSDCNSNSKAICQMDTDIEQQEADLSNLNSITPIDGQTIIIDGDEIQRPSQELEELPQLI